MFICFLSILFLVVSLLGTSYFSNSITSQRKEILLLIRQNKELKARISMAKISNENLIIKYTVPSIKRGQISQDCSLYLVPLEASVILSKTLKNSTVDLLYAVELFNNIWYQISISSTDGVTTIGWIKGSYITLQPEKQV